MADYLFLKCVVDTSLLIDLYIGNILAEFFRLPYSFIAPDVILAELQTVESKTLLNLGLLQSELPGHHVLEVLRLRERYHQPSVNDLFALVTARVIKATLLTNDKSLRKAACAEGIEVHGTLWVLDEMVRMEILTAYQAAAGLQLMCLQGSRLPLTACQQRLQCWLAIKIDEDEISIR
jgi:rRNA-processing protein FCF1